MITQQVFEGLPVRSAKSYSMDECSMAHLEQQLSLLMTIVSRVKQLPQVTVKQVPMMMPSGDMVLMPGPWSLDLTSSRRSSLTDGEDEPSFDEEEASKRESSTPDRFVVRNEFGHARLHQLLEFLDAHCDGSTEGLNAKAIEVAGHCVLPPDIFEECVDKGWGCKHPFAGRYHPITGTVVPSTTLLYYTPRDEREMEALWKIIVKSYEWAKCGEC